MNFLKSIRVCSTQRVSQQGATDSIRKMIIPADWLRKKITIEEAEAHDPGISDDRVSRFPEAARPFGFLNRYWETLKSEIKPGDEPSEVSSVLWTPGNGSQVLWVSLCCAMARWLM
jgi:hypothetical protein